jgi:hypothetical protein
MISVASGSAGSESISLAAALELPTRLSSSHTSGWPSAPSDQASRVRSTLLPAPVGPVTSSKLPGGASIAMRRSRVATMSMPAIGHNAAPSTDTVESRSRAEPRSAAANSSADG